MTGSTPLDRPAQRSTPTIRRFDARSLDAADRLAAFETFVYGHTEGFLGHPRLFSLGGANEDYVEYERLVGDQIYTSLTRTSGYGTRVHVGPDSAPHEVITIGLIESGEAVFHTERGEQGLTESRQHLRQGDVYINASGNFELWMGAGVYRRVVMPKRLIHGLDGTREDMLVLRGDDPVALVLRSAAESLVEGLQRNNEDHATLITDLVLTVTQGVIASLLTSSRSQGYDHIQSKAIAYIRDNLERADLSVDEVATYVHVSRATLYRAFESLGGLKEFVTSERIAVAKSLLRVGRIDRGSIAQIAYRTGFKAPEHFSKVFKMRTGLSPTQFVRSA